MSEMPAPRPVPIELLMLGTPIHFTNLFGLVPFAKSRARRFLYDGIADALSQAIINACFTFYDHSPEQTCAVLFTRDVGHHMGGWWKNPDYERCWHLSLSHRALPADVMMAADPKLNEAIARAFFGEDAVKCWIEPAASDHGRLREVWHYRLFCDAGWQPIMPRGEVYSRENTPADWKSFSEIHGFRPEQDQAPFLLKASE